MTAECTAATFERYSRMRVPRYTSYPASPHFSAEIRESDYRQWLQELGPDRRGSLYLHVPFCRRMCWYCGCHTSVASRDAPILRYISALLGEIGLVRDALSRPLGISHVHFGGGTPTLTPPELMRALMKRLRDSFTLRSDAEVAIEVDPRTLDEAMVAALGDTGFTRASIGVQTFDPVVQKAINRVQSFEETRAACERLRGVGIAGINLDLIYGLPHQTVASCRDTVQRVVDLAPGRLAVFGYAHVPDFKKHQRKIDTAALADGEGRLDQARAITEQLVAAGYVAIGLDHFARPDDALARAAASGTLRRNFQGYTTDDADTLIGLGSSAIGRLPQGYVQNQLLASAYQDAVSHGRLPTARGYRLTADDKLRAALIERLMCDYRVDVAEVCAMFAADPAPLIGSAPIARLERDGVIGRNGSAIAIPDSARPLVRSVAAAFDAHLAPEHRPHTAAV